MLTGPGQNNIDTYNWQDEIFLVADDDYYSFLYLEKLLQKTETKNIYVKNGVEAIVKCFKDHRITVALIDILMPELDGLETVRLIKKYRPEIICIAQTAYGYNSERNICLNAGFDDYLSKPITQKAFYPLIDKNISERNNLNIKA